MDNKTSYTEFEIAELLGVNPSSVGRWIDSGKLLCSDTHTRERLITKEQLMRFAATYNIAVNFLEGNALAHREERKFKHKKISSAI